MNIDYTILPFAGCIAMLLFVLFVLMYRPKSMVNFLFLLFCFTVMIWLFGTYKMFIVATDAEIVFWDHIIYAGVTLMPVFLYHFGVVYLRKIEASKIQHWIVMFGYIFGFIFLALSQFSQLFVSGVYHYKWGAHTIAGPFHHIFLVFFLFYFFGFLGQLIKFCSYCHGIVRLQLYYVTAGFAFFVFVGPFAYFPAYQIPTFPAVFIAVIPFVVLLFHAMIKYEFLSDFDELLILSANKDR